MLKRLVISVLVLGCLVVSSPVHASFINNLQKQVQKLKAEVSTLKSKQGAGVGWVTVGDPINPISYKGDTINSWTSPTDTTTNPTITPTPDANLDLTLRIAYWGGKVNQHIDSAGVWQSDTDGTSGADIDKLEYCRKFYPSTISTVPYKTETITTWRRAASYEQSAYTNMVITDKCITSSPAIQTSSITVLSPNGGENFELGKPITISWKGGKNKVQVGLMKADKYNTPNIASLLGWIDVNGKPDGSTIWDGQSLKDAAGNDFVPAQPAVAPGLYKIVVVSENAQGNYIIVNNGAQIGNNDVSDGNFSIEGLHPNDPIPFNCDPITLLSPTNGSTFTTGQSVDISWTTCQTLKIKTIDMTLLSGGAIISSRRISNSGQYRAMIPKYLPGGSYEVIGKNPVNGSTIFDGTFTIAQNDNQIPDSCTATVFIKTLRSGSRGDEVESLQVLLNDKGYLNDSAVNGYFGSQTRNALKQLQRAYGLGVTGTTGSATRAILNMLWPQICMDNQDDTQG